MNTPEPPLAEVDRALRAIAAEMAVRYDLSVQDAADMVAEVLGHLDLASVRMARTLRSEGTSYWAELAYYGSERMWWRSSGDESDLGEFPEPRTGEAEAALRGTVAALMDLFGVSEEEALGRTRRLFGNFDLVSDGVVARISHEEVEYWAHVAYYGREVRWWLTPADELRPEPWP